MNQADYFEWAAERHGIERAWDLCAAVDRLEHKARDAMRTQAALDKAVQRFRYDLAMRGVIAPDILATAEHQFRARLDQVPADDLAARADELVRDAVRAIVGW